MKTWIPLNATVVATLLTAVQPVLAGTTMAGSIKSAPTIGTKSPAQNKSLTTKANINAGSQDKKNAEFRAQLLKEMQEANSPKQNQSMGGIHGGGGNAIEGRLVASYLTAFESIPGYKNYLVYDQALKKKLPTFYRESLLEARKNLSFYVLPSSDFNELSILRTGIPAKSDQVALQKDKEVWINKTEFMKLNSDEERGRFLMHELTEYLALRKVKKSTQDIRPQMQVQRKFLAFVINSASMDEVEAVEAYQEMLRLNCPESIEINYSTYRMGDSEYPCSGLGFTTTTATEERARSAPLVSLLKTHLPLMKQSSEKLHQKAKQFCQVNQNILNLMKWSKDDARAFAANLEKYEKERYADLYWAGALQRDSYETLNASPPPYESLLNEYTRRYMSSFNWVGVFGYDFAKDMWMTVGIHQLPIGKGPHARWPVDPSSLKCSANAINENSAFSNYQVSCEVQVPDIPAGYQYDGGTKPIISQKIEIDAFQKSCMDLDSAKRRYDKSVKNLQEFIDQ